MEHPNQGILESEEFDHEETFKRALPYLGTVDG
ncbi:hypothetical protein lpari_03656 [Legionella parisiensis]|uniref:Uncharacterized protein n=1 Tax=Legionella parisiensis TaxID=45071 RepID=A0A1E5JLF2_9GAMM|nr:hypothetical protein lpari_03656 [Legionella parisiensis]STX77355.1 homospermidine synthase [Legionella parisiensis]